MKTLRQFFQYGLIGFIAMLVDFSLLYLFAEYLLIHYLIAIALAYLGASIFNFSLQKRITFKSQSTRHLAQFSSFFLIGLVGMLTNLVVTYISVEYFLLWYFYGKFIATGVAFIWNFTANKLLTFKA